MKIRILGCLVAFVVCLCRAHGPYDSSAQLIIFSDSLEFRATLGMDGARQLLHNAGLSEAETAAALSVRGAGTPYNLSTAVASHVVELTGGGQVLKVARMRVSTDGLEASFTATYEGSYTGDLDVRARYFNGIEALKPGAFVVLDDNRNVKDQVVFSSAKAEATVKLATSGTAPSATVVQEAPVASTTHNTYADHRHEGTRPSSPAKSWLAAGALIALGVGLILLFRMLRHSR